MGKLIYSLNVSLDGFVETPDPEVASPIPLRRTATRRFGSGVVYIGYERATDTPRI